MILIWLSSFVELFVLETFLKWNPGRLAKFNGCHTPGCQKLYVDDSIYFCRYPARKKIVYWIGYIISTPCLLMAANMLMQRRDVLYNFATMLMVVCIGLCSLAS
jgi:hypothetical protein